MTVALALPQPSGLSWRPISGTGVVARLQANKHSDRLSRLAVIGAFSYAVGIAGIDVSLILTYWSRDIAATGIAALIATAAYLPLHLRHMWFAVRDERPPAGLWTLAIMTAVILGAFPFAGIHWLRSFPALIVGALIVMRPPWRRWIAGIVLCVPVPLGLLLSDNVAEALWEGTGVLWRVTVLYVLVWLAASVRRLEKGRLALAEEAVARERHRIDNELEQTLGAALESIVIRGQRASARADLSPDALEAELRALVDGARATLAEARRMIRGYRQVSLRAELEAAASLLTAAGIETRLVLSRGELPESVEGVLRMALRSATARLLRDDAAETCVITVTREDGQVRLDVRADGTSLPTAEVVRL
jgi:two-component system sensor histidine kinase DesK